jgi:hypothetical protein
MLSVWKAFQSLAAGSCTEERQALSPQLLPQNGSLAPQAHAFVITRTIMITSIKFLIWLSIDNAQGI